MTLVLTEEQQLLRDSARGFCEQSAPISVLRKLRDERSELGYSAEVWQQMIELGWPGIAISEEHGGFDFGYGGLGVVLEETGRTLVSSPLIATVLLGGTTIRELGSDAQKTELLPKVASGELTLALALDEKISHAPTAITTSAIANDNGYEINGDKTFVLDGHVADKLLVVARTSGEGDAAEGISVFLVDREATGVNVTRTLMVDNRNAAKLSFNKVQVDATALVGGEGGAFPALDRVLDIARIGLAAEMLGSIEQVFAMILEYLKQREQFGVLIGSFQGLQHRAAEMYSEIELCKSAVRGALSALDDPDSSAEDIAKLASMTKSKLSEVFQLVSNEGVQMHGGIGMTDEFDVGFFIKRARVAQQFLGDASFHRDRYASLYSF